jgi:hypothetical protein
MTEAIAINCSRVPHLDRMGNFSLQTNQTWLYDFPQARQRERDMD